MTNKAVNDGEVLAAQQTVIATDIDEVPNLVKPNNKIEIYGTGAIQIGDADTTGVLRVTRAENAADNATASMSQDSLHRREAHDADEMPSLACSMWALSMLRYNSFHTAQPRASSEKKDGQHIMLKVPAKTYH